MTKNPEKDENFQRNEWKIFVLDWKAPTDGMKEWRELKHYILNDVAFDNNNYNFSVFALVEMVVPFNFPFALPSIPKESLKQKDETKRNKQFPDEAYEIDRQLKNNKNIYVLHKHSYSHAEYNGSVRFGYG